MNKVIGRLGALKADCGSEDSLKEEGPWPLKKLKREGRNQQEWYRYDKIEMKKIKAKEI